VSARTSTASNVRRFSSGVSGLSSMISPWCADSGRDTTSSLPPPVRRIGVGILGVAPKRGRLAELQVC
jgi:hypothetical protein